MSDFAEQMDKVWVKFAAAALESLVLLRHEEDALDKELVAKQAAEYADAMLKQWEKR